MDGYSISAGYDVICIDNFSNSIADEKGEVRGEIRLRDTLEGVVNRL